MPSRTGYQPLIVHLAARTEPTVWLTFDEIGALIGATLGWRALHESRHERVRFTRSAAA